LLFLELEYHIENNSSKKPLRNLTILQRRQLPSTLCSIPKEWSTELPTRGQSLELE